MRFFYGVPPSGEKLKPLHGVCPFRPGRPSSRRRAFSFRGPAWRTSRVGRSKLADRGRIKPGWPFDGQAKPDRAARGGEPGRERGAEKAE